MPKKVEPKWGWASPGAGPEMSVSVGPEIADFLDIKDEPQRQEVVDHINRALAQLLPPPEGGPTPKEIMAALDCLLKDTGNLAKNLDQIDEHTMTAIRLAGIKMLEKGGKFTSPHREIIDTAKDANRELQRLLEIACEFAPPLKSGPQRNKQEQLVFNSLIDVWCECKGKAPHRTDYISNDGEYTGDCHAFLTEVFFDRITFSPSQIAARIETYRKARA